MKSLWYFLSIAFLLLFGAFPAGTQGEQCVEIWNYWSDHVRHEVNLDTGSVTSYESPDPFIDTNIVDSPDGRYTASLESQQGVQGKVLILTENDKDVSIVVAENVTSPAWSPDSLWLSYVQQDVVQESQYLVLHNMDTDERISVDFPASVDMAPTASLNWSPDGRWIAAAIVVDPFNGGSDVRLYSAPDLTLLHILETTLNSAYVQWSPSAHYFAVFDSGWSLTLMDVRSYESHTVTFEGRSFFELEWSPGKTYLLIEQIYGDFHDVINLVNMQGEVVLQDVFTTSYQWAGDHQLFANIWTASGIDDFTFFDLKSGEQRVIQQHIFYYAVSSDGRYLAMAESYDIQIFDLSLELKTPVKSINIDEQYSDFIWREDRHELIVLFGDKSLRGYNFEAGTWQTIASIPGDEPSLRAVACTH